MLWTSTPGPITSKNRGTISIWTPKLAELSEEWQQVLVPVAREREHDALDVEQADEVRQLLRPSEDGQVAETVVALAWIRVDEADDVDAVFRVLEQLSGDELADLAGADDQRVLLVAAEPFAQRARRRAKERDADDRADPEKDQAADVRAARGRSASSLRRRATSRR